MELLELIKIIKKNLALILILGVISALSTFLFVKSKPLTYNVFFAITISQVGNDPTPDYKFDNYYSQQAIEIFTDSFEKWFLDPNIITEAYQKAGVNIENVSPKKRSRLVKARKLGSQYIEVNFEAKNTREGELVFKSLVDVMNDKVESLKGDKAVWFKVNAENSLITKKEWNLFVVIIVSFVVGAAIGIFFSLLKHYLKALSKN